MPIISRDESTKSEAASLGLEVRMLVDAPHGSSSLRIGELTVAPDTRVPRHIHTTTEEAMIILEGTVDALVGGQRMTIGPGHTVLAPAGTVHGFVNRYQEPARILFVSPTHDVDEVPSSVPDAPSGFASEKGLTGYRSADDRPLDKRK